MYFVDLFINGFKIYGWYWGFYFLLKKVLYVNIKILCFIWYIYVYWYIYIIDIVMFKGIFLK